MKQARALLQQISNAMEIALELGDGYRECENLKTCSMKNPRLASIGWFSSRVQERRRAIEKASASLKNISMVVGEGLVEIRVERTF